MDNKVLNEIIFAIEQTEKIEDAIANIADNRDLVALMAGYILGMEQIEVIKKKIKK